MRIWVEADPRADRAVVRADGDRLAVRVVHSDPRGARVAVVATEAMLLGGDDIRVQVEVGPRAWLDIVEVTGTVAYDGAGRTCSWDVDMTVGPDALLAWHGEPFVVCAGARVRRTMTARLGARGVLCTRDSLVLGRAGAPPGEMTSTAAISVGDQPLLVEALDVHAGSNVGILGAARVIDTVLVAGVRVGSEPGPDVFQLAGPGTMFRSLHTELHQSRLRARWLEGLAVARTAWRRGDRSLEPVR